MQNKQVKKFLFRCKKKTGYVMLENFYSCFPKKKMNLLILQIGSSVGFANLIVCISLF